MTSVVAVVLLIGPLVLALIWISLPFLVSALVLGRVLRVRRLLLAAVGKGLVPARDPLTLQLIEWCRAATDGTAPPPPNAAGVTYRLLETTPLGVAILERLVCETEDIYALTRRGQRVGSAWGRLMASDVARRYLILPSPQKRQLRPARSHAHRVVLPSTRGPEPARPLPLVPYGEARSADDVDLTFLHGVEP